MGINSGLYEKYENVTNGQFIGNQDALLLVVSPEKVAYAHEKIPATNTPKSWSKEQYPVQILFNEMSLMYCRSK